MIAMVICLLVGSGIAGILVKPPAASCQTKVYLDD